MGYEISGFAFLSLFEAVFCFNLGMYVLYRNPKAVLNRIFFLLASVVALNAFTEFQYRIADSAETALAWMQWWVIWPVPFAITLHFIIMFANHSPKRPSRAQYLLIYLPAALFITCNSFPNLTWVGPVKQPWGWTFDLPPNPILTIISFLWATGIGFIALGIIVRRLRGTTDYRYQQQLKYVLLAIFFALLLNIFTGGIPRLLGIPLPELYNTWFIVWCAFIGVAMARYELFALTPMGAAADIFALMGEAILLVDPHDIVRAINPAARQIFGAKSTETIGRPLSSLLGGCRVNVPEVTGEGLNLLLQPASISNLEITIGNQDGKEIPLSISKSNLTDKRGRIQGSVYVLTDLSDIKQVEAARLQERERVTQEFLGRFSHELRTPLNAIIGFTEVLVDQKLGPLNAQQRDAEQDVLDSGRFLLALINEVLDISKLDQGEIKLNFQRFTIKELLDDITPQVAQINTGKGCTIIYDVEDPTLLVYSSKLKLEQVLVNLMANGIKSSPPSKRVTLSIRKNVEYEVIFSVTVEGPGIKEEDKPAMFQNISASNSESGGGGLGLVISKQIAEILGGFLQVESTYGQGSTFFVRLPLK